jgi:PAS domain S-box-containing protein
MAVGKNVKNKESMPGRQAGEKEQADILLRQSERHFDKIIADSPMGYFRINREGLFEQVNAAWLNMHGYDSIDEILGHHFAITQVNSDLELAQKAVSHLMSGTEIPTGEFSRRNKDGSLGWHVFSAWPVYRDGQVLGLEGFLIDTTGQKTNELVNAARLRLLEGAVGQSLDEVLTATLDELEKLTDSQIGFFHFLGADQETLSLQTWSTRTLKEMCTAEGKGRHYPVSQAGVWVDCIRAGKPVIHNDYFNLPDRKGLPEGHAPIHRELVLPVMRAGMIMAILGVGNKPLDYTKKDVAAASSLADLAWEIIETKRMEEILGRSSREWYKIFDATTDAICLLDMDQNIQRVNKSMSAIFESTPRDLVGRKCWQVVHGTCEPLPDCPVRRMRESLKRENMELALGDHFYHVTVDPILNEQGDLSGAVHMIRDITERKKMERDIKNEMDKLEFMNSMMVDREIRMGELKKEVNSLLEQVGRPKKY